MFNKTRHHLVVLLMVTALSVFILACAGEKNAGEPSREGDASTPDRSIEKPIKAERISQEEYDNAAKAVKAAKKPSLLENPALPIKPDGQYAYLFSHDGNPNGMSKLLISSKEDGGILVTAHVNLNWGDDEEKPFASKVTLDFDERLRPIACDLEMPDLLGGDPVQKRVDFKAEKFGVEYLAGPGGAEGLFKEVEKPSGEIWPLFPHANIDIAIIAACTGLPEEGEIEVAVFNMIQDSIGRFSLKYLGEKNITFENEERTERAREYEAFFNDSFFGWLYFNSDGMLVMIDEVGGIHAEFITVPDIGEPLAKEALDEEHK